MNFPDFIHHPSCFRFPPKLFNVHLWTLVVVRYNFYIFLIILNITIKYVVTSSTRRLFPSRSFFVPRNSKEMC